MNSVLCRIISGACFIAYSLSNVQAAVSNTSVNAIKGTEPYYKALGEDNSSPVESNELVGFSVHSLKSWPASLSPNKTLTILFRPYDDDGDIGVDQPYGKRTIDDRTVGTYFTLIDPKTGLYRDIELQELELMTPPGTINKFYFVKLPYTWVGAKIGLELTAMTQYGNPSIGTTYKIDNPYKSDLIYIHKDSTPLMEDSVIRLPPYTRVGIWDAADITKIDINSSTKEQHIIPTDPEPYNFLDSANSPQLGHTYKALMWEDTNGDGKLSGFANGDIVINQIGTKTFYTWKLVNGNQPANGTVTDDTVITLVERSTDNSITLPATNSKALKQWPGVGLPIGEAALQGFTLQVDVNWEFNLNDAPPVAVTR